MAKANHDFDGGRLVLGRIHIISSVRHHSWSTEELELEGVNLVHRAGAWSTEPASSWSALLDINAHVGSVLLQAFFGKCGQLHGWKVDGSTKRIA